MPVAAHPLKSASWALGQLDWPPEGILGAAMNPFREEGRR